MKRSLRFGVLLVLILLAGVVVNAWSYLGEAHVELAANLWWKDWDWAGANREFRRALELNAISAHIEYGWFLAMIGEWDAAIDACQRSLQHAPDTASHAYASAFLGYAYLEQGDAVQALPLLEQAVQRFVQFQFRPFAGWFMALLAEAYRCTQRLETAQESAQRGLAVARAAHHGYGGGGPSAPWDGSRWAEVCARRRPSLSMRRFRRLSRFRCPSRPGGAIWI